VESVNCCILKRGRKINRRDSKNKGGRGKKLGCPPKKKKGHVGGGETHRVGGQNAKKGEVFTGWASNATEKLGGEHKGGGKKPVCRKTFDHHPGRSCKQRGGNMLGTELGKKQKGCQKIEEGKLDNFLGRTNEILKVVGGGDSHSLLK